MIVLLNNIWIFIVIFQIRTNQISADELDQNQLDTLAETLKIEIRVIDNLRREATNHIVRTTLRNDGLEPIPSSGWRLYFHSMLLLYPDVFPNNMTKELDVEQIRVGMVQGDLYYIEPMSGFKPLPARSARNYNIVVSLWAVQRTDFMPLWYVTSADKSVQPRIVQSTSSFDLDYVTDFDDVRQWKRWRGDRYNPFTPQERAEQLAYDYTNSEYKVIIPTPMSLQIDRQKPRVSFNSNWKVFAEDSIFYNTTVYITEELQIQHVVSKPNASVIILSHNTTIEPEGYTLNVDVNVIRLEASDTAGMFYAVQSLRSIMYHGDIPAMNVQDAPRYRWRGMHFDVARNFHTLADVKRLIDVMAMYKMNVLHLHLTDDEGWRLEIDGLPELTEVGGKRCHDPQENDCIIPQFGSGPFANSSGSGFFTKSQYREILSYATKNHIKVYPEFDMPAHSHAAVASMESRFRKTKSSEYRLVDQEDSSTYLSVQNWKDNVLNPCINSTYAFIGKVMNEVKALHANIQPLAIFHFGGDEVAKGAWEKSPRCKKFLRTFPRYNVSQGLKKYFVERVVYLAAERGMSLGGWEDGYFNGSAPIPAGDLSGAYLYVNPWNNIWEWGSGSNAYKLANAGYKVIMTQATNLYFDHPQEPDPEERGLYWATRFTDTRKVFDFRPDELYDNIREDRSGNPQSKHDVCGDDMSKCTRLEKPENVIGIQGALWSETIRTSENMDYMLFPRLLALAERAWHKASFEQTGASSQSDWLSFAKALGTKEFLRLEGNGVQYRIPPPGARVLSDEVTVTTKYPGLGAQYSSDNGSTWQDIGTYQPTNVTWNDAGAILLRATNAYGTRYSRSIKLSQGPVKKWSDQKDVDYIAANLTVFVEVVDNLDKDAKYFMTMSVRFGNIGAHNITAGSWKIYFYTLYGAKPGEKLTCGMTVGHVNGILYYFEPTSGDAFPGIPSNGTLRCVYKNWRWIVSRTDNMPNWYVAADGMKAQKLASTVDEALTYVGPFDAPQKWKRAKEDKYDPYTPAVRYDVLDRGPSQKRPFKIIPTPVESTIDAGKTMKFDPLTWSRRIFPGIPKPLPLGTSSLFNRREVVIKASTGTGALHGAQTLISLLQNNGGTLPRATVKDYPRYSYRGVMLDVARNFKPLPWILKFLDVMSMYKLNKLHLHLSDDEAWRVEIEGIPELTQVGAKRCHSEYRDDCVIPQLGSGPDTDTYGTGYYNKTEYQTILQYANERHIEIIPEIDMPAHSAAAIFTMETREDEIEHMRSHGNENLPESWLLFDHKSAKNVLSVQRWKKNAMNPCMNSTYRFVEKVIDGLIALHKDFQPLSKFHMGGDEVAHGVWNGSEECRNNPNIPKSILSDTGQLQRVFMRRVSDIVAQKNLDLAVWEDGVYADDKPNPIADYKSKNVFVYPWNNRWGTNFAIRTAEFADAGYKVILPLATHLYFDQPQEPDPESRGLYWATRFTDTRKVFGLMPDDIFANLGPDRMGNPVTLEKICGSNTCPQPKKTENIIGMQACMWAEVMRTEGQFHEMAFPRVLALAERAWHRADWETMMSPPRDAARDKEWEVFADALGYAELPRLEQKGVMYLVEPPGAKIESDGTLKANARYPGHVIEVMDEKSQKWVEFKERKLAHGQYTFHFRVRTPGDGRVSRTVELKATIKAPGSSAQEIRSSKFPMLFVCLWCMSRALV
ncbi:hypothetical protein DPMN_032435 [Dreissena polymorpha]|uniref:beta-N-acetylhexosaminidase n=1 Tax=Dreissena polymorpha TaxID=45954 RepID=A0A9D4M1R7_DREPO|nr:hypothetical protein DPMN_032435 [Dreissena polymorpha]